MKGSAYYDANAVRQVIGDIFKDPSLLAQDGQYFLTEDDFTNDVHRIIYGVASNIYNTRGGKELSIVDIVNYLDDGRTEAKQRFEAANGAKYITECIEFCSCENFKMYYDRIKKMTLLRNYARQGVDVSWLYDPSNLIDKEQTQYQSDEIDKMSLSEIADKIESRVNLVRVETINRGEEDAVKIGDGIFDFLNRLQESPEVGMPFCFSEFSDDAYSPTLNRITMGARKGKFFLKSAPSGTGKSRSLVADACMLACKKVWLNDRWVSLVSSDNGEREGVMIISTELDEDEVRSLMLSFISGVNEEKIVTREVTAQEKERILLAAEEIKAAPLYVKVLPNFTVSDVENAIKRSHIKDGCNYFFYDYLGTSLGILEEVSRRTRGVSMREDSILFLLSTRLKELAVQYNIFIESATQLSAEWKTSQTPDQNLLRGAKSIADRIDIGEILLNATPEDIQNLTDAGYIQLWGREPNAKLSIYKNRRGKYVNCYVWMYADKGTCRFSPIGATTWDLSPYEIPDMILTANTKGGGNGEL